MFFVGVGLFCAPAQIMRITQDVPIIVFFVPLRSVVAQVGKDVNGGNTLKISNVESLLAWLKFSIAKLLILRKNRQHILLPFKAVNSQIC